MRARHVAYTILVDLNFAWKPFAVRSWTNEDFGKLYWTPSSQFDKRVLLNDVCHLLLLLFALVDLLFKICDLLRYGIKAITVY